MRRDLPLMLVVPRGLRVAYLEQGRADVRARTEKIDESEIRYMMHSLRKISGVDA